MTTDQSGTQPHETKTDMSDGVIVKGATPHPKRRRRCSSLSVATETVGG